MARIQVVDDERSAREYLRLLLEQEGHEVVPAGNGVDALVALEGEAVDLVLSDLHMPEMNGLELLQHVKQRWPAIPFIMITAASDVAEVVEAVQRGAVNYLVKPVTPNVVTAAVARALAARPPVEPSRDALSEIVGTSKAIVEVRHRVTMAARSDVPVLVTGETGTGKELVARAIHRCSNVADAAFVPHNCAVSPRDLFESQFFGHRRGAFTGADRDAPGLLREADGGTLFLDELETLDPLFQAKLLRVLDDGEVRPVGSERAHQVSVRFVAATNREPLEMLDSGELREDLYYRLRGFEIRLPPLRERAQDIPLLVAHFIGHEGPEVEPEALEILRGAPWPGNVRELRNTLRGAAALAGGRPIGRDHLPAAVVEASSPPPSEGAAGAPVEAEALTLREAEKRAIVRALDTSGHNRTRAAKLLDIDRSTLRRKMQEYGLDDDG